MSSAGKRLDLRFGAFACSVQGFDDPVQPVQQVLRAIQHLLEESPELSDTAINFDAEAIEQLVGEVARRAELDENEVEIVPGLVIVHHGGAAPGGDGEAWAARGEEVDEERDEAGGYVNIFAPSGSAAEASDEDEADAGDREAAEAAPPDEFADRLRQMAAGGKDDYGWPEDEDAADSAEARSADEEEDEDPPLNLFAPRMAEGDELEPASDKGPRNFFAPAADDADSDDSWELGAPAERDQEGEQAGDRPDDAEGGYTAAGLAARAGAESVPELMISAAAWMVLVRGQTTFKRRDVLDVFDAIPGEHEKSLEAQIKGFGKAVRNGQLVMVEDGIFGLSRNELERFQSLL